LNGPLIFELGGFMLADARIYNKYKAYTLVTEECFIRNLTLARMVKNVPGRVVECGCWKGGMMAGIAEVLGPAHVYDLFDSFQGLPSARTIDGAGALAYQADVNGPGYLDNLRVSPMEAKAAMDQVTPPVLYRIHEGWFEQTLPSPCDWNISLLRLDADWYESTRECLRRLFSRVVPGGMVIIDDYYVWDGCAIAVHEFLADGVRTARIRQLADIAYILIA